MWLAASFGSAAPNLSARLDERSHHPTLMRLFLLFNIALLAAGFTACVSDAPDPPHLRVGMSCDDLRACFGEPLRIEPAPSGGENWYYPFTGWSPPEIGGATTRDMFDPNVSTVSVTLSSSHGTHESPVHVSGEGYVVDPLPAGKIVRR